MTETYEIRVRERLDSGWASRFDDFCVSHEGDGTTLLVGSVPDQAALHGLLMRVRDLGLTLLSVVRVGPAQRSERHARTELRLLLGACGLYCGACYHYRASFPEGGHLLDEAARQGRKLEGFTCRGCRSDALYVHPGCAQCEIRACADDHRIAHCGLCPEFPCGRIQAFQSDGRIHHRDVLIDLQELASKGPDRWLAQQARRWTCGCGAAFTWYEVSCSRCGAPLPSYGSDPKEVA